MSECARDPRGESWCLSAPGSSGSWECPMRRRGPFCLLPPHPVETSSSLMLYIKARAVVSISVPNNYLCPGLLYLILQPLHFALDTCLASVFFHTFNITSLYHLLSEFLVNSGELHVLFLSTLIISFLIGAFRLFNITFGIFGSSFYHFLFVLFFLL